MFKKLKNLFVVSDEEFKNNANPSETKSSSVNTTQKKEVKLPPPSPINGSADPKFLNILLGSIEKNNMEGFDYLEFKQSLQNLKDLGMDEGTKYNSAMAMAKTMGADSKSIAASANHYLKILKEEENKFKTALSSQQQKIDNDRTSGISTLENKIKSKEEQIKKLTAEIQDHKNKLKETAAKIDASTAKIQSTNDQFSHAYKLIVQQIVDDVNNIEKHVK